MLNLLLCPHRRYVLDKQHQMEIVHRTIFETEMAVKAFGLFIDGMNQDGSCANLFCGT